MNNEKPMEKKENDGTPAEKKRGRGRPSVTEKIAGNSAATYEKVITSGKQYRSRRSVADTAYSFSAGSVLLEAASEIQDLELICGQDYQCRSILNQLGRMLRIEGYSENDIIAIAKEAIKAKKDGRSVKDIELYIRRGRLTGEWEESKQSPLP